MQITEAVIKQDPSSILIVDDERSNLEILVEILSHDYQLKVASSGQRALDIAKRTPCLGLILLDISMCEMDGYAVFRCLKEDIITQHIPVIFVTSATDSESEIYGLQLGAVDYITKPVNPVVTLLRVRNQMLINQHQAALKRIAHYDALTGIPNRILFQDRLNFARASSHRSGKYAALLFIDLDNFKSLNDTLGHDMGDLLLQLVAQRLESCLREGDSVARLGGDEFLVLLENLSKQESMAAEQTQNIGNKVLAVLNEDYQLGTHSFHNTPSIGVTIFKGHEYSSDKLIKQADVAMYQSKLVGRNTLSFYNRQMQTSIEERIILESELRVAIKDKQFVLYFQAQVDKNTVVGAEALLRWLHPVSGVKLPGQFMDLAESTGLILPIGLWVLEAACAQLKAWEQNSTTAHLQLAVNISVYQLRRADFVEQVVSIIESSQIKPEKLKLEITESMMLDNIESTINKMNRLRELGVCFSMDDFGTGYSSLSSLKKLPLDQLKIDKSFVKDLSSDPDDAVIVKTIIAMTKHLGIQVIAEGVETEVQREFLEQNACSFVQGYLFSKPVPVQQFENLLNCIYIEGSWKDWSKVIQ